MLSEILRASEPERYWLNYQDDTLIIAIHEQAFACVCQSMTDARRDVQNILREDPERSFTRPHKLFNDTWGFGGLLIR